jgi:hypothetical protein
MSKAGNDMDELTRLLRTKRHETPGPEYFRHFLGEFHRYQRAELLQPVQPAALSWLERLRNYLAAPLAHPAFAFAGGAATCLMALGIVLMAQNAGTALSVADSASQNVSGSLATPVVYEDALMQQPELQLAAGTAFERDFQGSRYVTGQDVIQYETGLAF